MMNFKFELWGNKEEKVARAILPFHVEDFMKKGLLNKLHAPELKKTVEATGFDDAMEQLNHFNEWGSANGEPNAC